MFKKTSKFKNAIIFCYGKYKFVALQQIVPKAQLWAIIKSHIYFEFLLYLLVWWIGLRVTCGC
jgi:hypothetical protein